MIKYSQKESFCNVQLKFAPFGLRYENELVKGKNHLLLKITEDVLDDKPAELFIKRVCTGHGKPGKSWNLRISISWPGKSRNLIVGL